MTPANTAGPRDIPAILRAKAAKFREAADLFDAAAAADGDQRSEALDAAAAAIDEAVSLSSDALRTALGDIRREALHG